MMFQDANLLPWRNLRKNIEFPFEIKRRPVDQERVKMLLEEVGLAGFESPTRASCRAACNSAPRSSGLSRPTPP